MPQYTFSRHRKSGPFDHLAGIGMHSLGALALTALMLLFLSWMRWKENHRIPKQTIRTLETLEPIAPPPPAPPPPAQTPPEPEWPDLPQLDVNPAYTAPPLKARLKPVIRPPLFETEFELQSTPQPVAAPAIDLGHEPRMYALNELDRHPVPLNKPRVPYPASLARQGVLNSTVKLIIELGPDGRPKVEQFVVCDYPELEKMARQYAQRARFTPPVKDGRPVTTRFTWTVNLSR
ncbi:energy transducer TonB [Pontiella agarivorans]|uniref:Energy transducer TonB n=1 Tax=Pontiella agarivorans TaxID=3038953 RepID=A0ABU5MVD8_9BACT|nr:energy transducer TonB [Pontiella agarivorans]MDZ8118150.1 energy transducer TonB [Pontiella agarivorans]